MESQPSDYWLCSKQSCYYQVPISWDLASTGDLVGQSPCPVEMKRFGGNLPRRALSIHPLFLLESINYVSFPEIYQAPYLIQKDYFLQKVH